MKNKHRSCILWDLVSIGAGGIVVLRWKSHLLIYPDPGTITSFTNRKPETHLPNWMEYAWIYIYIILYIYICSFRRRYHGLLLKDLFEFAPSTLTLAFFSISIPCSLSFFFIEYIRLPLGCVDLIGTLKVFLDISRHHRLKMRFAQSSMISQWVGGAMWLLQIFPSDADGRKLWSEMAYNKHLLTISQWLIDVKIWLVLWFDSEEVSKETEFPKC